MEHVRVITRIRPEPSSISGCSCLTVTSNTCVELREPPDGTVHSHSKRGRPRTRIFTLDRVLGPQSAQKDVYEHVKP